MDWDDVRYFAATVGEGSFSRAAQSLKVEQSTLSRRIRRLERTLGVQLFDRRPEGVVLTEAGQQLQSYAMNAAAGLREMRDIARGISTEAAGLVRITCTASMSQLALLPRLAPLLDRHPRLRVEIIGTTLVADLLRREADIAVRTRMPEHPDLVGKSLLRLQPQLYIHQDHTPLTTLEGQRWVGMREPSGVFIPGNHQLRKLTGAEASVLVESFSDVLTAICGGAGIGYLYPEIVPNDAPIQTVGEASPPSAEVELFVVTHRSIQSAPRIKVVTQWLADVAEWAP